VNARARGRHAARERYVHSLQVALSCVSSAVWITAPRLRGQADDLALALTDDPVALRVPRGPRLYLSAGQYCRFVADDRFPGEWTVRTGGYLYSVRFTPDPTGECLAWHWHPATRADRHLHVTAQHPQGGDLSRLHVPTGWTTFEQMVGFLITELGVRPLRADWSQLLDSLEGGSDQD